MKNALLATLVTFAFVLAKFSVLPALGLEAHVHLSLIMVLFFTVSFGRSPGLGVAALVGLIDEIFALRSVPGVFLALYMGLAWWANYLINALFTNRSSYAILAVSLIGATSFFAARFFLDMLLYLLRLGEAFPALTPQLFRLWAWGILLSPFLVLMLYWLGHRVGLLLKNSFLVYTHAKK